RDCTCPRNGICRPGNGHFASLSQTVDAMLAARLPRDILGFSTIGQHAMQFVEANGAKIPAIGLGTCELRGRTCARLVEQALRLGYRHIDTAQAYDNEREVGDGLRASRVRRDEVFVTTKVWT